MRFISWNVNGLRACLTKGFPEFFQQIDADIFCLQETKLQQGQVEMVLPGYRQYWNSAVKKGYSGTAVFSKKEPLSVSYGLGIEEHDQEGRVITLEFPAFYLTTVYTPNSQEGLKRLSYRMEWEDAFRDYLKGLDSKRPVVVCGDMNVAHQEIDLKNPKPTAKTLALPMRKENAFPSCWQRGSLIPTVACIRKKSSIPGGLTASTPEKTMRDGALTIFWSATGSAGRFRTPKFTLR